MPIRFQADADFRTATAAGLAGLNDPDVLALAARDGRILVTHDHRTMPRYFGDFIRTSSSPGLIVVPQILAIRDAADALILIWAVTQPEDG